MAQVHVVITGVLVIHKCTIHWNWTFLTCLKETAARKAAGGCLFFYLYVLCYSGTEVFPVTTVVSWSSLGPLHSGPGLGEHSQEDPGRDGQCGWGR